MNLLHRPSSHLIERLSTFCAQSPEPEELCVPVYTDVFPNLLLDDRVDPRSRDTGQGDMP